MKKEKITLEELKKEIARFVRERDWEQYHSPKNLSMAIAIEAAELMEKFQWLKTKESFALMKNRKQLRQVENELADIAVYVIDFCNLFNINLEKVILKKLKHNAKKYPVYLVKGKAHKYSYYKKYA